MGISETRMRKLMEGADPGGPGWRARWASSLETIRGGGWCEEQGSLMRGLAFGILDPDGERYRLALIHRSECPACRAYVASLRGLAAVLPAGSCPGRSAPAALARAGAAAERVPGRRGLGAAARRAGAGAGAERARARRSPPAVGALSASGAAGAGPAPPAAAGCWRAVRWGRSSPSAACSRSGSGRVAWRSMSTLTTRWAATHRVIGAIRPATARRARREPGRRIH